MGHPVREIGQGSGDGVDVEPASRESVTESSSEASWRGASDESENRYLVRGLSGGALGEGASGEAENWYLVRGLAAWVSGESENRPRPRGCPSALIFVRSKQSFRFLLRVPLFMVSDTLKMLTSCEFAQPSLEMFFF